MDRISLEYGGKRYIACTTDDLAEAGVPSATVQAALAVERAKAISAECRRRIYSVASVEAQMNINGIAALIGAKTANQRTASENAVLAAHAQAVQWIADMRAAYEVLAADADADYHDDAAWPVCPAEVVALAAQF